MEDHPSFLVVFITMDHGDHFRPPSGNGPLPNGRTSWPVNRPGMILRRWLYRKVGFLGLRRPTWRFENSFQWCRGLGCFGPTKWCGETPGVSAFWWVFLARTSPHTGLLCVEVIYWCLLLVLGLRFEMSCQVMIAPLPSFFGDERVPVPFMRVVLRDHTESQARSLEMAVLKERYSLWEGAFPAANRDHHETSRKTSHERCLAWKSLDSCVLCAVF